MVILFRRFLLLLFLGLCVVALYVTTKSPQSDRNWARQFERVARFDASAPFAYELQNLRQFEYNADGELQEGWGRLNLNIENLVEAWFFVEPFASSDLFGHTFISFVFDDGAGARDVISVSVEARKEHDETYSAIRGVLREYELSYVWTTEKDTSTRIAVNLGHPLYAYKINQSKNQARVIFDHFVLRTNRLAEQPRFYNTVLSNCTNELFKVVNEAFPGSLPDNPTWLLTGRSARYLHAGGHVSNAAANFDDIKARARIDGFVRDYADLPARDFSKMWREAYEAQF